MQFKDIHEVKAQLSKYVDLAFAGEEIIICKAGKPMAKLVRFQENRGPRELGILAGKINIAEDFDEFPEFLYKAFYRGKPKKGS